MDGSQGQDEELWLHCPSRIGTLGLPLARLEAKIWLDLLPSARRENILVAQKLADSLSGLELWIEFIECLEPLSLERITEDVECLVLQSLARVGNLLSRTPLLAQKRSTRAAASANKELDVFLEKIDYLANQTGDGVSDSECSESEDDEDARTCEMSLETLSTSLFTAVSCLGQLKLAVESSCTNGKAETDEIEPAKTSGTEEVIPQQPADYFIRLIKERFNKIDPQLAKRLGEASWQRWGRLQRLSDPNLEEETEELEADRALDLARPEEKYDVKAPSTFIDSGVGSSIPVSSRKGRIPIDVRSLAFTGTLPHNVSLELPPAPREVREGKPFECTACGKILHHVSCERQWREHLFGDLQPYICCRDSCDEEFKTFSSSREWIQHDILKHMRQLDLPQTCPLCKDFTNDDILSYASHVASHLESISLSALPPRIGEDEYSISGSTIGSDSLFTLTNVDDDEWFKITKASPFEEHGKLPKESNQSSPSSDRTAEPSSDPSRTIQQPGPDSQEVPEAFDKKTRPCAFWLAGCENVFSSPQDWAACSQKHLVARRKNPPMHLICKACPEIEFIGKDKWQSWRLALQHMWDHHLEISGLDSLLGDKKTDVAFVEWLRSNDFISDVECSAFLYGNEYTLFTNPFGYQTESSSAGLAVTPHQDVADSKVLTLRRSFSNNSASDVQGDKLHEHSSNNEELKLVEVRVREYLDRKMVDQCPSSHPSPGPYFCLRPSCDVTFLDKQAWIRHQENWDPVRLWWCSSHADEFHHRSVRLGAHLSMHHGGGIRPQTAEILTPRKSRICPICNLQSDDWDFFYKTHVPSCMKGFHGFKEEHEGKSKSRKNKTTDELQSIDNHLTHSGSESVSQSISQSANRRLISPADRYSISPSRRWVFDKVQSEFRN